jgi:hypothetical protein
MVVALMAVCEAANAVPSVALNGNLYLGMTRDSSNNATVAKLDFTSGTAGVLNTSFFSTPTSSSSENFCNMSFYNHDMYVTSYARGTYYPDVWKVNGTTGVGTQVWAGILNKSPSMAVDTNSGDLYFMTSDSYAAICLHDGNSDGDYNDAGENTEMIGLSTGLWRMSVQRQDAEFYNGWVYFTTGDQWVNTHFISRFQATPSITGNIVAGHDVFTTVEASYGPSFLTVGDPNANGLTDIYAHYGNTDGGVNRYRLGHWEDADSNGILTSGELLESISLGNDARDVQLVTSDGHSMIIYLDKNMTVKYVNLLDNGSIDTVNPEVDTLFTTGLTPGDNNFVYLKMDQVSGSTEVPEPATLLLVGTGALSALGYIRRRKMS